MNQSPSTITQLKTGQRPTPVQLAAGDAPMDWVFTGDSIVAAVRWTGTERGYVDIVNAHLRHTCGRRRDAVINTAVSGWRVPALLDDLDHAVLRFAPSVVVIGLGTNDSREKSDGLAAFTSGYRQIIDAVQTGGAAVVLQTPPTVTDDAAQAPWVAEYADAVRQLAAETHSVLVDHHRRWSAETDAGHRWMADAIHPGPEGHRTMAGTFIAEALPT